MESKANVAGVNPAKNGKAVVSNPYHVDKKEYEDWTSGWIAEMKEVRRKLWSSSPKAFRSQAKIGAAKLAPW